MLNYSKIMRNSDTNFSKIWMENPNTSYNYDK